MHSQELYVVISFSEKEGSIYLRGVFDNKQTATSLKSDGSIPCVVQCHVNEIKDCGVFGNLKGLSIAEIHRKFGNVAECSNCGWAEGPERKCTYAPLEDVDAKVCACATWKPRTTHKEPSLSLLR